VEHPRKAQARGRLAGWAIALVATAASALALVGAGTAATPVLVVGQPGAVAWVAGPATVAAASVGATTVGVGPGAGAVVCHVGAAANVLGIPIVVRISEIRAFLLANPNDYLGTCGARRGGDGDSSANAGDGANGGVKAAGDAGAPSRAAGAAAAPAGAVPCAERLVIRNVQVAPLVIRSAKQPLLLRLVVQTGCGDPVRGAVVTLRSAPLGRIAGTTVQKTAADGSVVFASTTTKRLQLVRGGRLVLFARATGPHQPAAGCTTGGPLVSGRLVSIRTALPVG
jgi:hypothetical protein